MMKARSIERPATHGDGHGQARPHTLERLAALSRALTGPQPRGTDNPGGVGVAPGDTVYLLSLDDGSEARIRVVASDAGEWRRGTAALASPLGRALAGRGPAQLVEVPLMGQRMRFLILRVLPAAQEAAGGAGRYSSTPGSRREGWKARGHGSRTAARNRGSRG